MADDATFTVKPPLRCFGVREFHREQVCGARAAWMRRSPYDVQTQFFCDYHKGRTDVPIAADAPFRRITVSIDVMFAGVSLVSSEARAEAVRRLEQLVEYAGGLICLHGVVDQVGRQAPAAPPARPAAGKGRR